MAEAVVRGDVQARERMILANLGLVYMIALRYLGRGLAMRDLVGEGNLGLIRAVDGFRPERGVRFSTYACKAIERAVREALTCNSMIRLSIESDLLLAMIFDEHDPPDIIVAMQDQQQTLRRGLEQLMECLTDRERTVLTWRYGLNGEEYLTYEEMGRRLKLTKERVRQIEQQAIRKMIAQENQCRLLTRAL